MLIGLLIASNLSGFGTPRAAVTPAGGSLRSAQREWDQRAHWRREAKRFLEESDEPQTTQTVVAEPETEIVQPAAAITLSQLLDRTEGTPTGDALTRAMAYGKQSRIAQAAYAAALALRRNDDALALLLVLN